MSFHNEDNWPVEESTVKSIHVYEDGGFSITQESGWSFLVTPEEAAAVGVAPSDGDPVVVLGGLGHVIRGIFIAGHEYRYVTQEQADREREEWLANYEREKDENFYANIADWIKRKNALDKPFRKRMDRFASKGFREFWRESGAYELFTVEQANELYKVATGGQNQTDPDPVQWLEWFKEVNWETQKRAFPDLDEGHSGNTFGGMVWLAKAVAEGRDI